MAKINTQFLEKQNRLLVFILFSVLGFSIYANTLKGDFIWDDEVLVRGNPAIRSLVKIPDLFTQDMGGVEHANQYGFYRPLTMATYSINYALAKLNVQAYHLTNIFLHILTAFCIYLAIDLIFKDSLLALFTGALFVIYPVHTEVVAYISGRQDSLSAVFILAGFIFYIKYLESGKKWWHWFIIPIYALALLSKENSLIFPAILLLYHCAFKKDFKLKGFFIVLGLAFLYLCLRFTILKSALPHTEMTQAGYLFYRLPGFFIALANYIRILIFPFDLHYEYGNDFFKFYDYRAIIGFVLFSLLLIYAFLKRNKNTLLFFSICWFFITLLPCTSIYPINAFYMAEHWLYLPSIGFLIIISKWLIDLLKVKRLRWLVLFLVLSVGVFYSYLSIEQNNYWRGPVSFYKRTIKYAPCSGQIYYNLGSVYLRAGEYLKAISLFKKAIAMDPKSYRSYNNLANTYSLLGKHAQAIDMYKKAIDVNQKNYKAYNNLGVIYDGLGKPFEAIESYEKAIQVKPDYGDAYFNLAAIYFDLKQYKLSIQYCDKAAEFGYNVSPHFLKQLGPYKK